MKCPYCHIHYMDDERECPMCGKYNPNYKIGFGKKKQTAKKQTTEDASEKRIQLPASSSERSEKSQKKGVSWSKIFAALLVIIPLLGNILFDDADDLSESEEVTTINQVQPPESAYLTLDGVWECEETAEELSLSVGNLEYTLTTPRSVEQGQIEIVEESVSKEDDELELYFYEVKFYPDGVYGYTYIMTGAADSHMIVTMPADKDDPSVDDMQAWKQKEDTTV